MLRGVAIRTGRAKKQVEVPVEGVFDRVEATGAEDFESALVGRPDANVVYRLVRPAMLDDKVGPTVDGQRIELPDIEAVFNAAGFVGEIELEGLPFQVYNRNQHGNVHRGGVRRRMGLSYESGARVSPEWRRVGSVHRERQRRFGNLRLG